MRSSVADARAQVHRLFVIAGRITFIFTNYGQQTVHYFYCIASVLLRNTEPSLLSHVCLIVFLISVLIQWTWKF